MRITIVLGPFLPVPPILGGAVEKAHLLLAGAYRAAGHNVTIVSRKYKNSPDEEYIDGIRHVRIASSDRSASLAVNLVHDFFYALRVSSSLPSSDITITNSFFLPLLLRRHTAGKIYVHVARFPKHQMWLYARADRLQALSRAVADAIVRQAPTLARKVVTIGYPVPDRYFCPIPIRARGKIVLFVGRVAREKGVHLLLKSFASLHAKFPNWKLRIVGPHDVSQGGDGDAYLNELNRLARPLGPACEFAGPIFDERELVKEYQDASIFAYPSLAEKGEAFGLAPLEAMAAGCAVIVSSLDCFVEYVVDGTNAIVFDKTENALSRALAGLIANPQLASKIATNGNATAGDFRTGKIAAKLLDDFDQLVDVKLAHPSG